MRKKLGPIMTVAGMLAFAGLTHAQSSGLSARDLFYTSADSAPKQLGSGVVDNKAPLSMRYAILKLNTDGGYSETPPDTIFHANDQIRLKITANQKGFLYVVQQGSTGAWSLLFPSAEIDGSNLLKAGEPQQVPGGPGEDFVIDDRPGAERILILLAREPVTNFDKLIAKLRLANGPLRNGSAPPTEPARVDNLFIEHLRRQTQTRDLILTPVSDQKENAVYAAKKSSSPDDSIFADLTLNHQ